MAEQTAARGGMPDFVTVAIGVIFVVLLVFSYTRNVNWDEFLFLSQIYAFQDARLDRPLQTFFVHGFGWLTRVPGHEMGQIFVARLLMVGFIGITTLSIYRIAARITDDLSARIAVLAFLTSGFVLPYGASFRADPMAAALMTAAVALVLTTKMRLVQVVLMGGLCALAMLITIKSILFAPAVLGALIWRWTERGVILRTLLAGAIAVVVFGLLYVWHASGLKVTPGNDTSSVAQDAASTTFLNSALFPRKDDAMTWVIFSLGPLILAAIGLVTQPRRACAMILFAGPLLSVVVYRNAYPYFFPFATPLLMVAVAYGAQQLRESVWLQRALLIMVLTGLGQTVLSIPERTDIQRATLNEIHRLFPKPVPFIDDSRMVSSFPSVGFFMSSWGVQNYRSSSTPIFAELIAEHRPPLLIANKTPLMATMTQGLEPILLDADHRLLRASYVHYSGALWLAGQDVTLTKDAMILTVPFPGTYRVETSAPVVMDGKPVADGDVLDVHGAVSLSGPEGAKFRLVWDTGVAPLTTPLPDDDIYVGFWRLRLW